MIMRICTRTVGMLVQGLMPNTGQNSVGTSSHAEINRLSSELNSRRSREMDEMMNSVRVQIQRARSDAFSNKVLPQIQNAITADSGQVTMKGWNVPPQRPETSSEVLRNVDTRDNSRSEHFQNRQNDDQSNHNAYDMYEAHGVKAEWAEHVLSDWTLITQRSTS